MSDRLHVVVVSRWYPSAASPAEGVFVRDQVAALAASCDVTVLVPRATPSRALMKFLVGGGTLAGEETIPVPGWRILGSLFRWLVFERSLARLQRAPDVVHLHLLLPDGFPLLLVARRRRIPLVVTEHANFLGDLLQSPRARVQLRRVLRGAAALLTASTRLTRQLRELEPAARPITVGVPVDTELFRPTAGATRDYALAVAVALGEPKGTDVLLRAWAGATARCALPPLVLVGGAAEPFLELADTLGIDGSCKFVGLKQHDDVAELMRNASFFVSASRDENFAGVVAEAIASGTPVISTRVGEPEHYVTDEVGLLVPPGDVRALEDAIVDLAARARSFDPAHLHAHIATRYGFDVARRQLLEVYEGAIRAGRGT